MQPLEMIFRLRGAAAYGVVAVVFLSAQFIGVAHATEYGDPFHHHDETPCAVQFAVDTARSLIVPAALPALAPPIAANNHPLRLTGRVYQSRDASHPSIRGPPSFQF